MRVGGAPPRTRRQRAGASPRRNIWAPDPGAYGRFAVAVARRYSGQFTDPLNAGTDLPRVRLYQAWNEPNLPLFLQPQWVAIDGEWAAGRPPLPAHAQRDLLRGEGVTARTSSQPQGPRPTATPVTERGG